MKRSKMSRNPPSRAWSRPGARGGGCWGGRSGWCSAGPPTSPAPPCRRPAEPIPHHNNTTRIKPWLSQAREGAFGIGGLGFAPPLYLLHLWISVGRASRRQNRGRGPPLIRASGSGIAAAARIGTGWSPRAAREKGRGKGFERWWKRQWR